MAVEDRIVSVVTAAPVSDPASVRRAGAWVRRQAIEREWKFVRQRWRLLCTVVALFAVVTVPVALVTNGTVRGFVVGLGVASCSWFMALFVMQVTGTAVTRMGSLAERWTAEQLEALGAEWSVIHHVWFPDRCDADHVAIGPSGVYVIETKWWSQACRVAPNPARRVKTDAIQACDASALVRGLLVDHDLSIRVVPLLAWWSSQPPLGKSGNAQQIGKTHVMPGDLLTDWLHARSGEFLGSESRRAARQVIAEYTERSDLIERHRQ